MNCRLLLLALLLTFLVNAAQAEPTRIPLTVDEAFPDRALDWPVSVGVQLPENLVPAEGELEWRLVDGEGRGVPGAARKLGWWRASDSVQWLNLQFVARAGKRYFLQLGDGIAPAAPNEPIAVERPSQQLLTLRNGALRATFSSEGPAELIELRIGETPILAAASEPMQRFVDQNGNAHVSSGGEDDARQVEVETAGAAHTVIKCVGHFVGPNGEQAARYTTRYHFFAGSPAIKVSHAVLILTDTEDLQFKEISWRLPLAAPEEGRTVTFDASGEFDDQLETIAWTPETASLSMAQEVHRHYGNDASHFAAYLREKDGGEREVFVGEQGGQIADVAAEDGAGLTVGLRHFWQQFPKEIEVTKDEIAVHLWSKRGGQLDFRLDALPKDFWGAAYDFWKTDPQSQREMSHHERYGERGFDTAKGLEKSHEIWLWPRAGKPAAAGELAEFGRLVEQPPLALADPAWNCDSGVFGPLAPKDPARHPEIENMIDTMLDQRIAAAGAFGDYGWWAHGFHDHASYATQDGKLMAKAYRFAHNTYFRDRSLWQLYFRSGERRILDYLLPLMWHKLDIRMKRVEDERWLRGAWGPHYVYTVPWWTHDTYLAESYDFGLKEMLWTYYATGDERWREWADLWVESSLEFTTMDGWPEVYVNANSTYTSAKSRFVRSYLGSLIEAYAHSGDETLRERARELMEAIVDLDSLHGFRETVDDHKLGGEPYYLFNPLHTYWRQTGDERALNALRKALDYQYYIRQHVHLNDAHSDLAWAYAMTGNEQALALADSEFHYSLRTRLPELAAPVDSDFGLKSMGKSSADKQLWDGLPRLAWGLNRSADEGRELPPPSRLPPVSNRVALEKPEGHALTAEFVSETPVRRVLNAAGDVQPASWIESTERVGGWWETFFVSRVQLPPSATAGTYLATSDSPLKLVETNAPRYAAAVRDAFVTQPYPPDRALLFPVDAQQLLVRVRFPDDAEFRSPDGQVLQPAKVDGQRLAFTGLKAGSTLAFVSKRDNNTVELSGLPTERRWAGFEDADRFFTPEVALTEELATKFPDSEQRYAPGVFGQAANLAAGRQLRLSAGADLLPTKEGTVEFWYRPGWNALWQPKDYFEIPFVTAEGFRLFYAGHLNGDTVYFKGSPHMGFTRFEAKFRPGPWRHIAICWRPFEEAKGRTLVVIYVDGQTLGIVRTDEVAPKSLAPAAAFFGGPSLLLGAPGREHGALFDEFRVSNIARYLRIEQLNSYQFNSEGFLPPRAPLEADEHTRVLLRFDGNAEGEAGANVVEVEASEVVP